MSHLNQMEVQNLREIIGSHQMMSNKLTAYANQCQDPQVKQMLQQAANSAKTGAQNLMTFL